jgi:hypothetical protein
MSFCAILVPRDTSWGDIPIGEGQPSVEEARTLAEARSFRTPLTLFLTVQLNTEATTSEKPTAVAVQTIAESIDTIHVAPFAFG